MRCWCAFVVVLVLCVGVVSPAAAENPWWSVTRPDWVDWTGEDWCDLAVYMHYTDYPAASPEHWLPCIRLHDWPADEVMAVMWGESLANPGARSPRHLTDELHGGSFGLMQIALPWVTGWPYQPGPGDAAAARRLWDPRENLRIAHKIWLSEGWGPWTCKPYWTRACPRSATVW